jgi:2-polyprenyl-3-methyl-5-hydroxy-6-metoxy-1,4-benzoquinol methylase
MGERAIATAIRKAVATLHSEFSENPWFMESFWPENEHRIRLILRSVLERVPPPARVLDIGCFNGFLSLLLRLLGYEVLATDSADLSDREALFHRHGIVFIYSNLNTPQPFRSQSPGSFDVAVMGEVIEHILNHPLGLMKDVARILRKDGLLILTTPNPSTLINAIRILGDAHSLWGTEAFLRSPKIERGKVTDIGDVHFREYRTREISALLQESQFKIREVRYFAFGIAPRQSMLKRVLKGNPLAATLMRHRLFGANQYVVATRE